MFDYRRSSVTSLGAIGGGRRATSLYLMTFVVAVLLAHRLGLGKKFLRAPSASGWRRHKRAVPTHWIRRIWCTPPMRLFTAPRPRVEIGWRALPWYVQPGREAPDPVLGWCQAGWHVGGTALARLGHSHEAREGLV